MSPHWTAPAAPPHPRPPHPTHPDDGVQLHSLPGCIQISAASRTAKSAAFAWDEARQLLATAGRRKVGAGGWGVGGRGCLDERSVVAVTAGSHGQCASNSNAAT